MHRTLVTTDVVAAHLDDPHWVVIDCRFDLADTKRGEQSYRDAHIRGAAYAHLDRDLSGEKTGRNGRHPLPDLDRIRATFGRLGIGADDQAVVYDQDNGMYASRLWWMLRYLGHGSVALLDGGFAKWVREGRPTGAEAETPPACDFPGEPRDGMLASAEDVQHLLGNAVHRLVDARAPERYAGAVEPLDPVAGHIPGAANHPFVLNLAKDGTFRSPEDLRQRLQLVLGSVPSYNVVSYCGSGVTACHNLLAMEHAGLAGARLYAGSWSEWCSDPSRPVERSAAPE